MSKIITGGAIETEIGQFGKAGTEQAGEAKIGRSDGIKAKKTGQSCGRSVRFTETDEVTVSLNTVFYQQNTAVFHRNFDNKAG